MAEEKLDTEIRREQIAEAALALVAARGVHRLSVAAVARRVGLVPSGIYRHFKSKDEILMAVLDLIESRLLANVQAARDEAADPLDRLRGVLFRHVRFIREGRTFPRIVFSDDAHSDDPKRKARVQRIAAAYLGKIAELVAEGQAAGCIRADLDPPTAALLFLGIVMPAAILWHLSDGGFDVTRHAERAWQVYRSAIAVKDA
ncbi:MAG: TetR/AcrR family transcriptional regulator [Thermoguttaceae bacterium]|jgi:AcrR family transcriptional regulator|nr:TetR/AcrR family transcriptional regulator [Thermoguttaceae bacterium]